MAEKHAVIKINHRQYLVKEGAEYTVDKFDAETGKMEPEVLAAFDGKKFEVGNPLVKAKVVIEVLEQGKGEKITTRTFKAKARYRRTHGYRQRLTKFKVVSIN